MADTCEALHNCESTLTCWAIQMMYSVMWRAAYGNVEKHKVKGAQKASVEFIGQFWYQASGNLGRYVLYLP